MQAPRARQANACLLALFVGGQSACAILEDIVAENEPSPERGGGAGVGSAGAGAASGGIAGATNAGSSGAAGAAMLGGASGLAGVGGNAAGVGGASAAGSPAAGTGGDSNAAGSSGTGGGLSGAAGIGGAGAAGATSGSGGGPSGPPCLLDSRAFCDTLTSAAPGGRAGDLDETRWHVARLAQTTSATAPPFVGWFPAQAADCSGAPLTLGIENDLVVCGSGARSGLLDALHVDANYNREVDRTLSVRQPFIFENRTGRIVFDLGSASPIERADIWLTRDALTGLGQSTVFPLSSLRVRISRSGCTGNRAGLGVTVSSEELVRDIQPDAPVACFETGNGALVHYEIQVARDHVDVLTLPPGGAELVRLGRYTATMAFARGYLHLVHGESISDSPGTLEVRWANVGFDGPTRGPGRSYDFPNSLAPAVGETVPSGYVSIGYALQTEPSVLTVDGVDLSGQPIAVFAFNVFGRPSSDAPLDMRWNGNAARYYYTTTSQSLPWQAVALSVPASQLVAGTNRIELSSAARLVVANLGLRIEQPEAGFAEQAR